VFQFGAGAINTITESAFVGKLDSTLLPQWGRDIAGASNPRLAVDRTSGDLVVVGSSSGMGPVEDGSGGGITIDPVGGEDAFVLKYDTNGVLLWHWALGEAGFTIATSVAIDADGSVYVAGMFNGTIDLGGNVVTSAGDWDIFLVKLDPQGALVWGTSFGDANAQSAPAIAVDGGGNVLMTGRFRGTLDFGDGPLESLGTESVFLVKFAP
jgi:hypothetical protein